MTPDEAMESITATGFLKWCQWLDDKVNAFHREDYFLASIAYEVYLIRKCLVGLDKESGEKMKEFKDFLFTFKMEKVVDKDRENEPSTPIEDQAAKTARSKAAWMGMFPTIQGKNGEFIRKDGKPIGHAPERATNKTMPPPPPSPKPSSKPRKKGRR